MLKLAPLRRRRFVLLGAGLIAAGALVACASLLGERQVDVPLEKLQSAIERRFPADQRVLALFDLHLSRPQLALLPDDRLALTVDASLAQSFLRNALTGSVSVSGRLVLDTQKNQVVLAAPRLERFAISGMDEAVARQVSRAANGVLERALLELPVYSFRPEALRYAGVQYQPTAIATTASGLRVTLVPAPAR
jgi:hypothetical protein